MNVTLFRKSANIGTVPDGTLTRAAILASRVIRSDFHISKLCGHFKKNGADHIDQNFLRATIAANQIFTLDRIRNTKDLAARATTYRNYDPWCIYLNPLMLYEMVDREKEEASLANDAAADPNPGQAQAPFDGAGNRTVVRTYNSIHYANWIWNDTFATIQNEANDQLVSLTRTTTTPSSRKSASSAKKSAASSSSSSCAAPDVGNVAVKVRQHSDLTVVEKNVLMLMILLVHEADRLLHWAHSALFVGPGALTRTPMKAFSAMEKEVFTDFGHIMERHLYGCVIQHAYHEANPIPFAISEILGALGHQGPQLVTIVTPGAVLRGLLTAADPNTRVINEDTLKFKSLNEEFDYDPAFGGEQLQVVLGVSGITTIAKIEEDKRKAELESQRAMEKVAAITAQEVVEALLPRKKARVTWSSGTRSSGSSTFDLSDSEEEDEEEKEDEEPAIYKSVREKMRTLPRFNSKW